MDAEGAALAHQLVEERASTVGQGVVLFEEHPELIDQEQQSRQTLAGLLAILQQVFAARLAKKRAAAIHLGVQGGEAADADSVPKTPSRGA